MPNEKKIASTNISKEYKPSKGLKIFLTCYYILYFIFLIISTPFFIYFTFIVSRCESYEVCTYVYASLFAFVLSMLVVFIFSLRLRREFINIVNGNSLTKKRVIQKVILWISISILVILLYCALFVLPIAITARYYATGKPVIYLYPEKTTDVKVRLDFQGTITADYPDYDNNIKGWEVEAHPDGQLINKKDNQEYSYLYWEGDIAKGVPLDMKTGFVVKGSDTKKFLQETLKKIGLTPKEYNEFIVYWYPIMMKNKYNYIHFAGKDYTDIAPLTISPQPDSVLRVFMVFKALDKPIAVEPQAFPAFERKGFTVVEWGGIESK